MGGRARASGRLDYFLRRLNGSVGATHTSHALLGNEPNLNVPWLYDWTQQPFKAQRAVRRAILGLYDTSPSGYPGNDDLGTLSSWYVFGALGLYPEAPKPPSVLGYGYQLYAAATVRLTGGRKLQSSPRQAGPLCAVPPLAMRFGDRLRPALDHPARWRGAALTYRLGHVPAPPGWFRRHAAALST
jgi:putative alpha-1,2-mannosidase